MGIPEDVLRAVAVRESDWHQGRRGDRRDGVHAGVPGSLQDRLRLRVRVDGPHADQVAPNGSLNPGTEPLRWKSTAFNVDSAAASVRYYYDGRCTWCRPGYGPGEAWESIGAHYSPSPWRNADMMDYIAAIQKILGERPWDQPGF